VYKFLILRSNVVLKYMLLVCLCIRSGIPPFTCARSALEKLRIKQENDISEVTIYFMKDVFYLLCSKLQVYAWFVQSLEFLRKC